MNHINTSRLSHYQEYTLFKLHSNNMIDHMTAIHPYSSALPIIYSTLIIDDH